MIIANPLPSIAPAFPVANKTGNVSATVSKAESATPAASSDKNSTERSGSQAAAQKENAGSGSNSSPQGLDSAALKQLTELKARDREVRAHEAAHQAVGGQYAGAISYVYDRGPDGAQYAVGGEVSIDTAPVEGNPQLTIEKMRTVRSAALAPAEPSPQDRSVAAQAMQLMLQAQAELVSEPKGSLNESQDQGNTAGRGQGASDTYQSVSSLGTPGTTSADSIRTTA